MSYESIIPKENYNTILDETNYMNYSFYEYRKQQFKHFVIQPSWQKDICKFDVIKM
jgi:hypothetical protein